MLAHHPARVQGAACLRMMDCGACGHICSVPRARSALLGLSMRRRTFTGYVAGIGQSRKGVTIQQSVAR